MMNKMFSAPTLSL